MCKKLYEQHDAYSKCLAAGQKGKFWALSVVSIWGLAKKKNGGNLTNAELCLL